MTDSAGVADLHMHTVASDGTCSVADRGRRARDLDLKAIAITDHDSVSADIDGRQTFADGLRIVSGVEVRADVRDTKVELLGYFIDPDDERLTDVLADVREYRRDRNRQIITRLHETTSFSRSYEYVSEKAGGIIGRPHIADILINDGVVDSISAAFNEHLAHGGTAFVPMERVPAPQIIDAIQGAGGIVSLAHPGRIRADTIREIVDDLVESGLDAIEVQYPYDAAPTGDYADVSVGDAAAFADEYGLLQTGGSDCHGPGSGKFRIGEVRVSDAQFDALRECADNRRPL